jgi:hypothetical protein
MLKQGVLKIKNNFIDDIWTVTKSQEVAEMIVRDVKVYNCLDNIITYISLFYFILIFEAILFHVSLG